VLLLGLFCCVHLFFPKIVTFLVVFISLYGGGNFFITEFVLLVRRRTFPQFIFSFLAAASFL